jgi:hypothetical protein
VSWPELRHNWIGVLAGGTPTAGGLKKPFENIGLPKIAIAPRTAFGSRKIATNAAVSSLPPADYVPPPKE